MTGTTTTVAAVRSELVGRLQAAASLAGVLVTYEEASDPTRETVHLDGDVEYDGEYHAMKDGRKKRDGNYSFDIVFRASSTQSMQLGEARAVEMLAVLEDIMADDPGLGGAVPGVLYLGLSEMELETDKDADGFAGVELRARVEVKELLQ